MNGKIQRERVILHISDVYGIEPEYPWLDSPDSVVSAIPPAENGSAC